MRPKMMMTVTGREVLSSPAAETGRLDRAARTWRQVWPLMLSVTLPRSLSLTAQGGVVKSWDIQWLTRMMGMGRMWQATLRSAWMV